MREFAWRRNSTRFYPALRSEFLSIFTPYRLAHIHRMHGNMNDLVHILNHIPKKSKLYFPVLSEYALILKFLPALSLQAQTMGLRRLSKQCDPYEGVLDIF